MGPFLHLQMSPCLLVMPSFLQEPFGTLRDWNFSQFEANHCLSIQYQKLWRIIIPMVHSLSHTQMTVAQGSDNMGSPESVFHLPVIISTGIEAPVDHLFVIHKKKVPDEPISKLVMLRSSIGSVLFMIKSCFTVLHTNTESMISRTFFHAVVFL